MTAGGWVVDRITAVQRAHAWRGGILGCECRWNWPEERTYFCGEEERIAIAHADHVAGEVAKALQLTTETALQLTTEHGAQLVLTDPMDIRSARKYTSYDIADVERGVTAWVAVPQEEQ